MNWRHCQQPKHKTSRQQVWSRRSNSTERGIEDKHDTPITGSGTWAKNEEDGWIADIVNNQHKTNRHRHWWWRSRNTERGIEDKLNTQITESEMWTRIKCGRWMSWRNFQQPKPNKQTPRLEQKEQEHWEMHWRQTQHSYHLICHVSRRKQGR